MIAVILAYFGVAPFLDGLRSLGVPTLVAAVVLSAVATVCAAARWHVVTIGLGVPVRLCNAVWAYYGSQFLNSTLPGGILGDVYRGLREEDPEYPRWRRLRAVSWERSFGQVVQVVLTTAVILVIPSPFRPPLWVTVSLLILVAIPMLLLAMRARTMRASSRPERGLQHPPHNGPHQGLWRQASRLWRVLTEDWHSIRQVWGARRTIVLTSAIAASVHVGVFLLAAYSVAAHHPDMHVTIATLLPISLIVLLIAAIPLNVAGWGPREGAAAWAFALVGYGASAGISVSVAYGVLALVATLPGAVALIVRQWGGRHG